MNVVGERWEREEMGEMEERGWGRGGKGRVRGIEEGRDRGVFKGH